MITFHAVVEYAPVLVLLLLAALFPAATLLIAAALRPGGTRVEAQGEAYECGVPPSGEARGRIPIRFYLLAVLFVVFDVEAIFLFPWAVRFRALGGLGFAAMLVFLGILLLGYAYAWKKGALTWV
ncbi:MAG TPA: NADH-quinone oxidoreductase subunit A [Candidatus Polarisedimenticolia bacterium]|nr:NADH-quinone oxidoreductase subunit A [Candidatus Polarisedimenticolia bacterium]